MSGKSKKLFILMAVILLSILTTGLVFIPQQNKQNSELYIVKEYNGKIGVFSEGHDIPVSVIDVFIDSLPENDRMSLKNGIKVDSEEDLFIITQDLES